MRHGTIGTIIIGIILVLSAFVYLDRIIDWAVPIDWIRVEIREFRRYEAECMLQQLKNEETYRDRDLAEYQKENERRGFDHKIEIGRKIIFNRVEEIKSINSAFVLMQHPLRLFILFFVTFWLLVVGLGFLVFFPWARWFVFLSVITNYLWQFYTFLYDKKIADTVLASQKQISQNLGVQVTAPLVGYQDPMAVVFFLQTLIFIGCICYFMSETGKNLFKEAKVSDLDKFLDEIKVRAQREKSS